MNKSELLQLLKVHAFDNKIRLGANTDCGYVIADIEGNYDCYISAGISDEESFSRDFINKYNMNRTNSFGFDGTIKRYPYKYTKKISFIRKNINTYTDDKNANLSILMNNFNSIFLKMDIEGAEVPWLLSIEESQLKKFKQIAIEFHGILNDGWGNKYEDKIKCLKKLSETHYLVHAHGNNFFGTLPNKNIPIPELIELTYVNKDYFQSEPKLNTTPLPIQNLDYPCYSMRPDLNLNFYPFVSKSP